MTFCPAKIRTEVAERDQSDILGKLRVCIQGLWMAVNCLQDFLLSFWSSMLVCMLFVR